MSILCAKAKRRKHEDGKETTFYHFDSEISTDRIERFKKTTKVQEMASPSAGEWTQTLLPAQLTCVLETPVNVRYHTPRPEHSTGSTEMERDHRAKSVSAFDFPLHKDIHALGVGHRSLTPSIDESVYEIDTAAEVEEIGLPTQDTEAAKVRVDQHQDLHFMPDRVSLTPPVPFLQPCPTRDFSQNYDELWSKLDLVTPRSLLTKKKKYFRTLTKAFQISKTT